MKIHTGDTVQVISGKFKGATAEVTAIDIASERITIKGAGIKTLIRHVKGKGTQPGQTIEKDRQLHVSSLAILDPKTKKPTRIGYRLEKGKKVRFAKASGQTL